MRTAIAERDFDGVGRPLVERELDTALAVAARSEGLTFIAVRVQVVATTSIVAAFPDAPLVAWSSPDGVAIVGVGIAHELRGVGADRWREVARAARKIRVNGVVVVEPSRAFAPPAPSATPAVEPVASIDTLGFARPRFLGGGAWAPSAADAAPWTGFGDAWFVLPRWTYVHDQETAWLVLAVDGMSARENVRWHGELAAFRASFTRPSRTALETDSERTVNNGVPRRATPSNRATSNPSNVETPNGASNGVPAHDGSTAVSERVLVTTHANVDLWRAQVEAITSAISNGDCSKIVAARTCSVALMPGRGDAIFDIGEIEPPAMVDQTNGHSNAGDLSAARVLGTLDTRHADCFRVLVRPPGGGTLVAATPERLVQLDGDTVRCDALAGTVRLETPDAEAQLRASDKDRREHEIVVDAIRDALEGLGAHVDAPSVPAIKRLRHVLHLHTPIRATAPNGDPTSKLHLLDLAACLHPTPAVGGTPTAFAVEWIRDHEPVPRGWYASPVGWFDLDGNGELAVAIRSGVLVGNHAHLWAGAGIVAGSDPDRELAETELKLRAMLGALTAGVEP